MRHTKNILSAVALGAAGTIGLTAQPATAQSTGLVPVRAKIGVLLPQNSTTRNFSGNTHLAAEVDVSIPQLGAGKTFLSAGIMQGSNNGGKLRMIPVTISRMFSPPNPVGGLTGNVYFGAGAGAYFLRASAGGVSQSKTTLGGFGVVGYQFPNPYFVEAKYHVAGKVAGIRPGGLAIMVGRRF